LNHLARLEGLEPPTL